MEELHCVITEHCKDFSSYEPICIALLQDEDVFYNVYTLVFRITKDDIKTKVPPLLALNLEYALEKNMYLVFRDFIEGITNA